MERNYDNWEEVKDIVVPIPLYQDTVFQIDRIPFIKWGDVIITFGVIDNGRRTTFGNASLERWGITKKELEDTAIKNAEKLNPILQSLESVIRQIAGGEREDFTDKTLDDCLRDGLDRNETYVLKNGKQESNGAMAMCQDWVLEKIAEAFGTDFFILPSSIHEVLVMSTDMHLSLDELLQMVKEINRNEVRKDEWLSDRVFLYSDFDKCLRSYGGEMLEKVHECDTWEMENPIEGISEKLDELFS